MKILAIGAHPDDIEIFMYGLLCIFKTKKYSINLIVSTDGSLGGTKFENLSQIRKEETIKALKYLAVPEFLDLPDSKLGYNQSHREILREKIDEIYPDLIITHYYKDYHSDHRVLSRLVTDISGHKFPILYCETMMGINFNPNFYFDISEFFLEKKKAIMNHNSQNPSRFVELAHLMNSYRSAQCNAKIGSYAEAYYFRSSFPFTNINKILPNNIEIKKFDIDESYGFL